MKKFRIMFLLPVLLLLSSCQETIESKDWDTIEMPRVSVHDPSITSVTEDGEEVFYIFGSHLAQAKSKDLVNWEVPFQTEYEDLDNNIILGDIDKNLREAFEWAGKDDADSAGGYSIWAPDVIWNPNYKWKNGDMGAYMYYYSATSTWRRSNIGFAVSKTIEGPYTYQDTVVYSGFTQVDSTDGSDRNTHYKNTHLKKLISTGVIDEFSSNWVLNSGTQYNTDYAPNAIDPTLFYDENEKLWMVYGSWSGGMYILPIDEKTGIPMYPGIDSENQGLIVDRYFGTKLIGGYHQSGEGPYIVYDKETQSYYLFVTYGQLHSSGGYNMRLFKSDNPDGPYVDMKNQVPVFSSTDQNSQYGVKIMGNYQFSNMNKAYKSSGHNSAIITEDGQWMLVYHTRFTGGESHEVRVHPMMMNRNGWPTTLPFEYVNNEYFVSEVGDKDIIGRYEFINHGTTNDPKVLPLSTVELRADKTITGDVSGTWDKEAQSSFISFVIEDVHYEGVIVMQQDETKEQTKKIVFSAIGDNNQTIWGVKK